MSALQLGVKSAWQTTLYSRTWDQHQTESAGIKQLLYGIRDRAATPIASGVALSAKSQTGLFESDFDLFRQDHADLTKLVDFLRQTLQGVVMHANQSAELDPRVDPARLQIEFVDSWFHITNDRGFHDAHCHSGCSWCGIYYVQIGDMSQSPGERAPNGVNRFYSPINTGGAYRDFGNRYLDSTLIDVPPADGLLVVFPSYLIHSALPYRGTQDRIVISFNARVFLGK